MRRIAVLLTAFIIFLAVGTAQAATTTAPVLRVNADNTISFNLVEGVRAYKFVDKVPGRADFYYTVTCTTNPCTTDPRDWPGLTVRYGARTEVTNSRWAAEVSITYPTTPPPPPPPAPPPASLAIGMTGTPDWLSMLSTGTRAIHAKSVRLDVGRVSSSGLDSAVSTVRAAGGRPELLWVNRNVSASTVRAAALRYGPNATSNLPLLYVELGNEDSYSYKGASASVARSYGSQVKAVAEALIGTGVKVIPQADEALIDSTTHWVREMYVTFPHMDSHPSVGGWTIHPYGPNYMTRLRNLVAQTTAQGAPASFPIFITEYGLSTDNGRCLSENYGWNRCMTYVQAGETIHNVYNDIATNMPAVKLLTIYHEIDGASPGASTEREAYFGVLRREGATKSGYTNVLLTLSG